MPTMYSVFRLHLPHGFLLGLIGRIRMAGLNCSISDGKGHDICAVSVKTTICAIVVECRSRKCP